MQSSTITGTSRNDTLTGTTGNDTIDGLAGADTMTGLAGDDTYIVDNTGDKAVEAANAGTDTVMSSVSFTLGPTWRTSCSRARERSTAPAMS